MRKMAQNDLKNAKNAIFRYRENKNLTGTARYVFFLAFFHMKMMLFLAFFWFLHDFTYKLLFFLPDLTWYFMNLPDFTYEFTMKIYQIIIGQLSGNYTIIG
jgi:hypothetical protein